MSRILLVDDSPHAQRMGERILSEEGYEVVTVSNADSALIRLDDVDPDVVLADTVMPGRTGYEICQYLKMSPRHRHVRVILTAGVLETLDEAAAARVEADGTLRKPFEASALIAAVKPLAEAAAEGSRRAGAPRARATRERVPDGGGGSIRRRGGRGTGARRGDGGAGCFDGGDGGRDCPARAGGAGDAEAGNGAASQRPRRRRRPAPRSTQLRQCGAARPAGRARADGRAHGARPPGQPPCAFDPVLFWDWTSAVRSRNPSEPDRE